MNLIVMTLAAAFLLTPALAAGAQAPAGKTLLEIVTTLEREAYGPITEVSLERGRWEVDTYKDGVPVELHIDPATGRILNQHPDEGDPKPPANAKKLSAILKDIEAAGYTQITDVSFETRTWEVEAWRGNAKRELRVDPVTGKIVFDRADD
jgi:uncharacterized membrane protein YkoI